MSRRSVSFMTGAFVASLAIGSVVAFDRQPGRTAVATDYKQLADATKNVYDLRLALRSLNTEAVTIDELYLWSTRWMAAASAVSADADDEQPRPRLRQKELCVDYHRAEPVAASCEAPADGLEVVAAVGGQRSAHVFHGHKARRPGCCGKALDDVPERIERSRALAT